MIFPVEKVRIEDLPRRMRIARPVAELLSTTSYDEYLSVSNKHKGFELRGAEPILVQKHRIELAAKECHGKGGGMEKIESCMICRLGDDPDKCEL